MEYEEYIEAVEREAAALVTAFRAGPDDAHVPTCPEWTIADLADHVGAFSGFWAHVLCDVTGRKKTPYSDMPQGPAIADWYEELAAYLVAELRATEPDAPAWTWMPDDQSANFVARRTANELAIHRFDAQTARGTPEGIEAKLSVDGIEEIFVMIAAWQIRDSRTGCGAGETLHLHALDRRGEWLLTLNPAGLGVERHHAKAALAVRGKVSDLELLLYHRPPLGEVEQLGDRSCLDAWYRAFTFG